MVCSLTRARHPGMRSQVGLRKHHYEKKISGGDGIPVELFQILEDDAVKVLCTTCQKIWKIQQWPHLERSVFIPIPKKSESEVAQSCPTLWDPMDCSLPGFSLHGILQARVLEWVPFSFSRGPSLPRD